MITSEDGIKLIKHFEGTHYNVYLCPALLYTVGVGHLLAPEQAKLPLNKRKEWILDPKLNRTYTEEEVNDLLKKDLRRFELGVSRLITIPLKQCEFDALVSFSFNLGLGTLQRSSLRSKLNRGDKEGAMDTLMKYCRAGGKILRGLERRRIAEINLFFKETK